MSQNTNLKLCSSCKRYMNYQFFGESRAANDGFNRTCKFCRNQKRRLDYGSSTEPYLLNLKKNNEEHLSSIINNTGNEYHISAVCLQSTESLMVYIAQGETTIRFHIFNDNKIFLLKMELLIQTNREQSIKLIKKFILQELIERSIRLVRSEEERFNLINL